MTSATSTPPTVPIGTAQAGRRTETDSLGPVQAPAEHYWGAQTQRSLTHFSIGDDRMPKAVYHGTTRRSTRHFSSSSPKTPRFAGSRLPSPPDEGNVAYPGPAAPSAAGPPAPVAGPDLAPAGFEAAPPQRQNFVPNRVVCPVLEVLIGWLI